MFFINLGHLPARECHPSLGGGISSHPRLEGSGNTSAASVTDGNDALVFLTCHGREAWGAWHAGHSCKPSQDRTPADKRCIPITQLPPQLLLGFKAAAILEPLEMFEEFKIKQKLLLPFTAGHRTLQQYETSRGVCGAPRHRRRHSSLCGWEGAHTHVGCWALAD